MAELSVPLLVAVWFVSTALGSAAAYDNRSRHRVIGTVDGTILMLAAGNTTAVWERQHVRGYQAYLGRTQVIERIHPACLR